MIDKRLLGTSGAKVSWTGPGPEEIVSGNPLAGYYGEVPQGEFLTTDEIKNQIPALKGFTTTTDNPTWLKFSYEEKTLFIPMNLLFRNISWDYLYIHGLIYGEDGEGAVHNGDPFNQLTTIKIGSQEFIVRTMGTDVENPSTLLKNTSATYDTSFHYGEWVDLLYRVCSYQVANYPTEKWASYSPNELFMNYVNLCRETTSFDMGRHIVRGNHSSRSDYISTGLKNSSSHAWRPVLELVERKAPLRSLLFNGLSVQGDILPSSAESIVSKNAILPLGGFTQDVDFIIEPASENTAPNDNLIMLDGFKPQSSAIMEPSREVIQPHDNLTTLENFAQQNDFIVPPSNVTITVKRES